MSNKSFDSPVEESAVNGSFEKPHRIMYIKDIYKQNMVLCQTCDGLLGYNSFLEKYKKDGGVFSTISNIHITELLEDNYKALVLSCPICEHRLGIKFVD